MAIQSHGSAPQSGFVWDEASGYYYDAASGFYYDGNTGMSLDGAYPYPIATNLSLLFIIFLPLFACLLISFF